MVDASSQVREPIMDALWWSVYHGRSPIQFFLVNSNLNFSFCGICFVNVIFVLLLIDLFLLVFSDF